MKPERVDGFPPVNRPRPHSRALQDETDRSVTEAVLERGIRALDEQQQNERPL